MKSCTALFINYFISPSLLIPLNLLSALGFICNCSNRLSRVIWFTGILIFLLIVGGVILGLVLSCTAPSNQQPEPLSGSADSLATSTSASSSAVISASKPAQTSQTSFHVTPTYTLNHRKFEPSSPLAVQLAQHFGVQAARGLKLNY